jgi:hypothetical protein
MTAEIHTKTSGALVSRCRWVDLPKKVDTRGALSFVESRQHIPFGIRRVYYLYDIPPDAERGAHGHRELEQLMIPLAGSFDVELNDGSGRATVTLNDPARALYICPMIWRELRNFSAGAVCLVLASLPYDERDYFRDYSDFLGAVA